MTRQARVGDHVTATQLPSSGSKYYCAPVKTEVRVRDRMTIFVSV